MAIKINGDEVITNARALQNITSVDGDFDVIINQSIVDQANFLVIYDNAGTEVKRIYGALAVAP